MPKAIVIAGPNGSGKSTLIEQLRRQTGFDFPWAYINADDIALDDTEGTQEEREHRAFRAARELRRRYREQGISHAYETVLSHPSGLIDLLRLRESGFHLTFVYATTDDPAINILRVAGRVLRGGHDVPVDRIINRWHRSMSFLPRAVEIASQARLYDSSDEIKLVALAEQGILFTRSPLPIFLQERVEKPLQERAAERRQIDASLLPGESLILPEEAAGIYHGTIRTALSHYNVHQTGPTSLVRHDNILLTSPVAVGEAIEIVYKNGYGACSEY